MRQAQRLQPRGVGEAEGGLRAETAASPEAGGLEALEGGKVGKTPVCLGWEVGGGGVRR